MRITDEEIERIVREVIRRLTSAGVQVDTVNSTLKIEGRLVTLATIEGRLEGIQKLVVMPKAVVTPSVRDELRDKKVELVRQTNTRT